MDKYSSLLKLFELNYPEYNTGLFRLIGFIQSLRTRHWYHPRIQQKLSNYTFKVSLKVSALILSWTYTLSIRRTKDKSWI